MLILILIPHENSVQLLNARVFLLSMLGATPRLAAILDAISVLNEARDLILSLSDLQSEARACVPCAINYCQPVQTF